MNNKKLIVGITAIALAAGIFVISEKMTNAKPPEHRAKFFPELEERHITALVINEGGAGVKLEKENGVWIVKGINPPVNTDPGGAAENGAADPDAGALPFDASIAGASAESALFPADSASVQIAVEKIIAMKKSDLISDNPANQTRFEVDSASGMTVEIITSGKTAGTLRIGKPGPEWNSNYVRLTGSDAVYLIRGGIKYSLPTDIEQWKKKEPEPEPEGEGEGEGNGEGDNVLFNLPE